jgi:hypothetical protein
MTRQDEYEKFVKNAAQSLNTTPEAMEVILDMGRTLYYDRLADWAEFDMNLKPKDNNGSS